jgi:hypothetical protein
MDVRKVASAWLEQDPDPTTKAEIEALLASPDLDKTDLADRFAGGLEFGTAGLRGVIGGGPNRMNRAVVLRTTWGLAKYLKEQVPGGAERGENAHDRTRGFRGRVAMTPSTTPLESTAPGAPAPSMHDAALTSLWLHDRMAPRADGRPCHQKFARVMNEPKQV